MQPTPEELNSIVVAKHLLFVYEKLNKPVPEYVASSAKHPFGNITKLDNMVFQLCEILGSLDKKSRKIILKDKSEESRSLAKWWLEHQKAERAIKKKNRKSLVQRIREKLTPAELDAITKYM